ncbi:hypothetical protein ACFQPA_06555 [Halomarina halobia]|uniref:Uncharacterized protein n=1 Tax=Halomarina halobia TaxID=3033386 RepID=A0ABD6A6Q8_9EURY|nr:hypothetical protein [Halomarina sp. PSR21]
MSARGQSETLSYVLVFSLVVASTGLVYVGGYGGLQDAQQAEQLDNMGRAFDVLAANLADIHHRNAPSRGTEVYLSGGAIGFDAPVEITVRAVEVGNASNNATFSMNPRPLVYSGQGDTTFVYVSGAVIRTDDEGGVMRIPPGFEVGDDRAVLSFVVTYPQTDESFSGRSPVLIVGTNRGTGLDGSFTPSNDTAVSITVDSPRADIWSRYFDREGYTAIDSDASDGSVTYQFTTERLYVYRSVIEFDLKR